MSALQEHRSEFEEKILALIEDFEKEHPDVYVFDLDIRRHDCIGQPSTVFGVSSDIRVR